MTPCLIDIVIEHPDGFTFDGTLLQRAVDSALEGEGIHAAELTVVVVDRERSDALHREHFDVEGETDVMTFPDGSPNPENERIHLGDLVICLDVAREIAAGDDMRVGHEMVLYVVHGLLHILGFDDIDAHDRQEMWERQRAILEPLGIPVEDSHD